MENKVTVTFTMNESKDVESCLVKGEWMEELESFEILREDNVDELTDIKDELLIKAVISGVQKQFRERD